MPEAARAALPALFISDLHLTEDEPANVAAFLAFLQGPAREAASLFILGDLFEYWAGDDDLEPPFNAGIAAAIRALADAGTAVFFMTGNRDLLAGADFARAIGATLLQDPARVRFGDRDDNDGADAPVLLLAHGDALCTDDLAYQAFRRQVRDAAWQAGFLAQPLAARKAFIAGLRQK
ncbi:MAG: UDP-2,3-diacylglucosamine diphosphatase, partial [Thauera sp.]